jgi:hypothetical protein
MLENSTHNHQIPTSQIANQEPNTSKIYNLNTVEKNVYAQNEKASPFNSNTLKKSLIHSDNAVPMLSFSFFSTKCIFAEIHIG